MNIYKSIKRFLRLMKNRKTMLVLCVILFLPILAACSGTEPVEINVNNNEQLSESEPDVIEIDNEDQSSEAEINPLQELFAEGEGKIAFWTTRDGNGEIYLMDVDGGNQINLTNNDADELYPTWSPDGSKIAFTSSRDSNYELTGTYVSEIYVMNADGSEPTRLTNNEIRETGLEWSPDGGKIVFDTNWDNVTYEDSYLNWKGMEIGVMDADGSNMIRLTTNGYRDDTPAWSPDGRKIVFSSDRDGDREIYVMDSDGGNVVQLTYDNWSNSSPAWSPDGSKITFTSERDEATLICLMNADGSNLKCLENGDAFEHAYGSSWSPDGKWILFSTNGNSGKEIYVMNANGIVLYRLIEGGVNSLPVWQP